MRRMFSKSQDNNELTQIAFERILSCGSGSKLNETSCIVTVNASNAIMERSGEWALRLRFSMDVKRQYTAVATGC